MPNVAIKTIEHKRFTAQRFTRSKQSNAVRFTLRRANRRLACGCSPFNRLNLVILVLEKCIFQRNIHSSKVRTEIGRFVKKVLAKLAMSTTLWLCLFFCYRQSHIVTRIFPEEAPSNTESQQGMKRLENQFDAIAAKLRRNPM